MELAACKAAMRAEVRLRIASVPTADIHRLSARVLDRLAADPVFQGAERVSVFLNMPGKVVPQPV